jgi:rhodanese-related sulfurtransferase
MLKTITREELRTKRDNGERFHLVDVQSPEAFYRSHIPGSENVPVNEIELRATALWEPDDQIIVYCQGWDYMSSAEAAAILDRLGFVSVYNFEGGIEDWLNGGGAIAFERRAA